MARNKVMKLWTVIVTAFLALCTALGLVTTTASAAVPQTEPASNSESENESENKNLPNATASEPVPLLWSLLTALPPTMKQRIQAEAHGKSPSCRHRPTSDTPATDTPATADPAAEDCAEAEAPPAQTLPADAPPPR